MEKLDLNKLVREAVKESFFDALAEAEKAANTKDAPSGAQTVTININAGYPAYPMSCTAVCPEPGDVPQPDLGPAPDYYDGASISDLCTLLVRAIEREYPYVTEARWKLLALCLEMCGKIHGASEDGLL